MSAVVDDLDPAAVERAARAYTAAGTADFDGMSAHAQERLLTRMRAALAAAGLLVTTVSADPAAVIAAEEERIKGYVDFDEHRDQAVGEINGMRRALRLLAAAGLLVTPEHDAQVAARAGDDGTSINERQVREQVAQEIKAASKTLKYDDDEARVLRIAARIARGEQL